jgi:hypothetical protein
VPPERRPTRQQFVEDRPHRVDIHGWVSFLGPPLGLLGRHVAGRAHDRLAPGQRRLAVEHLGQSEVADLGRALGRQEHVGGLEVAMDDAEPMGLGDPQGHLLGKSSRPDRWPGSAVELLVQAAAREVLQLEEG